MQMLTCDALIDFVSSFKKCSLLGQIEIKKSNAVIVAGRLNKIAITSAFVCYEF